MIYKMQKSAIQIQKKSIKLQIQSTLWFHSKGVSFWYVTLRRREYIIWRSVINLIIKINSILIIPTFVDLLVKVDAAALAHCGVPISIQRIQSVTVAWSGDEGDDGWDDNYDGRKPTVPKLNKFSKNIWGGGVAFDPIWGPQASLRWWRWW